jgi:hypothetical protein
MAAIVSFTESDILTAARALLLGIVPAGVECIKGQVNLVPEPLGPDYVVFWPLRRERLSTNVDADLDSIAVGEINLTTLTIASIVQGGPIVPGMSIAGPGLILGSMIGKQLTGTPGGIGTYAASPSQNSPLGNIYFGTHAMMQPVEFCLQVDCHGPNSGDIAQAISTVTRDPWGCTAITRGVTGTPVDVQTLFASDPAQMPFIGGESQWAERWSLEWHLQANLTTRLFQDFFDEVHADMIPVDILLPGAFAIGVSAIGVGKIP